MATISYDDIAKICKDFVNDPDTTIGMECDWMEYLILQVKHGYTKAQIMAALNASTADFAIPLDVRHERYGDMTVYIAVYEDCMEISTRDWLLNDENEYRNVMHYTKNA